MFWENIQIDYYCHYIVFSVLWGFGLAGIFLANPGERGTFSVINLFLKKLR